MKRFALLLAAIVLAATNARAADEAEVARQFQELGKEIVERSEKPAKPAQPYVQPTVKIIAFSADKARPQTQFRIGKMVHCALETTGDIKKIKWQFRPEIANEDMNDQRGDRFRDFCSPADGWYEIEVTAVDVAYEICGHKLRIQIGSAGPDGDNAQSDSSIDATHDPEVLIPQWAMEVQSNNRAFEATRVSKIFSQATSLSAAIADSRKAVIPNEREWSAKFFTRLDKLATQMKSDVQSESKKLGSAAAAFSETNFCGHVAKALESVH